MDLPVDISFDGDISGPLVSTQPENCSREDLKSTKIPFDLSPIQAPNVSPFRSPFEQLTKRNKSEKPFSAKKLFSFEKNDRESSLGVTPLNRTEDNLQQPVETKAKVNPHETGKKTRSVKSSKESHKLSFDREIKDISLVRPFAQFAKQKDTDLSESLNIKLESVKTEENKSQDCEDKDEYYYKKESSESSSQRYEINTESLENRLDCYKEEEEEEEEQEEVDEEKEKEETGKRGGGGDDDGGDDCVEDKEITIKENQRSSEAFEESVKSLENEVSKNETVKLSQDFLKYENKKRKCENQESLENKRNKKDESEDN